MKKRIIIFCIGFKCGLIDPIYCNVGPVIKEWNSKYLKK